MTEDELWAQIFAEAERLFGRPLAENTWRVMHEEFADWVAAHRLPEWARVILARILAGE